MLLVDVQDLEVEARRAVAFAEEKLRYAPWTGERFVPLGEIPALAEAFDTPEARFAAWMRARRTPWLTILCVLGVAAIGALQIFAMTVGAFQAGFGERITALVMAGATGYEPLLLDGGWWTPWTSQLLHAGAFHLVMNLPLLVYCGYRVERALGPAATLLVAASAVLGGTLLVTVFGTLPVIGASIAAYGLWGAQITVGIRHEDAIPPGWKGFYGWGNLVLFIPLFLSSLGSPGVSHLGHIGGLLGGVLAAALVRADSTAPRAGVRARQRRNLGLAAAVAAAPGIVATMLSFVPAAVAWPTEEVEAPETGVTLRLPWRMAENRARFLGMPAWLVSGNSEQPLWVGIARWEDKSEPLPALLEASLEDVWPVEPMEAPPSPVEGWTAYGWRVRDEGGDEVARVVELVKVRGSRVWRAGYRVDTGASDARGREALYRWALGTMVAADPPALVEARRKHEKYPDTPELTYDYAVELALLGETAEADRLYAALDARGDGWAWDAARARLALWNGDAAWPGDAAWVEGWLAKAPAYDTGIQARGIRWLAAHGGCATVTAHLGRLVEAKTSADDLAPLLDAAGACDAVASP